MTVLARLQEHLKRGFAQVFPTVTVETKFDVRTIEEITRCALPGALTTPAAKMVRTTYAVTLVVHANRGSPVNYTTIEIVILDEGLPSEEAASLVEASDIIRGSVLSMLWPKD